MKIYKLLIFSLLLASCNPKPKPEFENVSYNDIIKVIASKYVATPWEVDKVKMNIAERSLLYEYLIINFDSKYPLSTADALNISYISHPMFLKLAYNCAKTLSGLILCIDFYEGTKLDYYKTQVRMLKGVNETYYITPYQLKSRENPF